ncbi:c-type cytochrome [Dankookia rubra]|uniref:C-type cytochrome n=1 Tax=Dankookia rubra TaxID=1442381 RepID=A0A4R5QFJ6_9PROT|nr:c-type cytochrome [Dankookia rubra]TDH62034.1 c-type cytochrome [Dankookia rubra]
MRASLLAAAVLAAAPFLPASAAGDAARGGALVQERQCGTCHGAAGVSSMPNIPSLAGHTDEFITLQLILLRERIRIAPPMNELSQGLTDAQVEDIAAHYMSLPPGPPAGGTEGDPARMAEGAALSETLRCGVCHLPDYRGRAQMPRLAGQREDYLVHALVGYRDGTRHGTDTNMNAVMYGVTDAQVAALAYYMARQK